MSEKKNNENFSRKSRVEMGSRTIMELPNEILYCIFSYLKMYDLKYHISGVCKQWEALARDRRLWRTLTYETTSEGTKTFGLKSWQSTLKFLESTPQLQNIVISQGHSEAEVLEILNALNIHCLNLKRMEMELTPAITKQLMSLSALTDRIESLRLWLIPERSQREVFTSLIKFSNLREVTFVNSNPQHREFQSFLANCPNLQSLDVSNDEFCKTNFLMLLKKKNQLTSLFIRTDNLDAACINQLSTFPKLVRLRIADYNASAEKLTEIGRLPCLEGVLLREDASSPVLTSSTLVEFFVGGSFSNLRELRLHKSRLSDDGAAEIRRNCLALNYLEVITYPKSPSGLTAQALVHFLHCRRLDCFEITFDSSDETDWIYRRIRYVNHDCDIDGLCPLSLSELLLSWDEIQIPVD